MTFLLLEDVLELIEQEGLNQITNSDDTRIDRMELEAISEMRSYLMQRYDVDKAFLPFTTFDINATYKLGNRIKWTVAPWLIATAYVIGDYATGSDDNIYRALTNTTGDNPISSPLDWVLVVANNSIYYNIFPFPYYNGNKVYYLNDHIVFYDKIYKATRTIFPGIQPLSADGTVNTYWEFVSNSSDTSGVYPEDTAYWTQGDNRSGQLVQKCVDILLYHLHARINPRNIPEMRMIRYDGNHETQIGGAIGWLKNVASGKINAEIPERYEFATVPGVSISSGNSEFLRSTKSYC